MRDSKPNFSPIGNGTNQNRYAELFTAASDQATFPSVAKNLVDDLQNLLNDFSTEIHGLVKLGCDVLIQTASNPRNDLSSAPQTSQLRQELRAAIENELPSLSAAIDGFQIPPPKNEYFCAETLTGPDDPRLKRKKEDSKKPGGGRGKKVKVGVS